MSPTAALKCPHERRRHTYGSEGVASVASDEDGGDWKDYLKEASEKIGMGVGMTLGVHQDGQQRIPGCKGGVRGDPDIRPCEGDQPA